MTPPSVDILHVVPAYWPRAGGVETLVAGMAEGLFKRHNLTSAVITPRRLGDPQEEIFIEGIPVIPAPLPRIDANANNFKLIHRLFGIMRKTCDRLRPRIVHIHAYSEIALMAAVVTRASGIPCIFHVHGLLNDQLSPTYFRELKTAEHVYAVSQAVADSLPSFTERADPIIVIPNAIRQSKAVPVSKQAVKNNVPVVLMIGRLEDGKGFEDGIRAIHRVIQAGKTVKGVIIGRGGLGTLLHDVAIELGIDDYIEFKGEMSYEETQEQIAAADILLAPSREIEGFSLVCLEAAFLEVPVVASAVGGIPETVANGYSGLLAEPRDIQGFADALLQYLNNPAMAREHGLQGRQRALNIFTFEPFIDRWAAEYNKIMLSDNEQIAIGERA